ncbi:MAG: Hsp20/alpha crystallin family protein [Deltaproteobacteria bacterium]|nr:Hsp20/alpha crystallin family protein [Deltaproteobacteria bacterium]
MWHRKENTPTTNRESQNQPARGDDYLGGLVDDFFRDWNWPGTNLVNKLAPLMNIAESGNTYHLETELPGVSKDQVSIEFNDGILTIKGEKKGFDEAKKDSYHRIERTHGQFTRSVKLPPDADPEKISASMENGLLHVNIEKQQQSKDRKRTISIR